jgi:hypothetical protein
LGKKPVVAWFEIISEKFMVDGGRLLEVLDDYSRAVAGYFLSFEAPSAVQTAVALRSEAYLVCAIEIGDLGKTSPEAEVRQKGVTARNGNLSTLRRSRGSFVQKKAPEFDYSSFYVTTGTGTPAALLRRI